MGTDDLFSKRKGKKHSRKVKIKELIPYRYLIVCEGQRTEVNYFLGIKQQIDARYKDKIDVKDAKIDLDIEGTGRNTESIVRYALRQSSLSDIPYGHVWVVFDRDDFSDQQFNNAIQMASDNGIQTAWSNEAIELWFVLHFDDLSAALHRYQYIEMLNRHFKRCRINGGRYDKGMSDIYNVLCSNGSLADAIARSKRLLAYHCELGNDQYCRKNPCTTVHILVEELLSYLA